MFVIDPSKVQNSDDLLSQIFLKSSTERVTAAVSYRQKKLPTFTPTNNKEIQKPSIIVQQFLESQNIEILPKIETSHKISSNNVSPLKQNKRRSISQNSGDVQKQFGVQALENQQKASAYCYNNRQMSSISYYQTNFKQSIKQELKKRDLTFNDLLVKVSQKIVESEKRNSPKNSFYQNESPQQKTRRIFQQPILKTRQKGFASCTKNKTHETSPINLTQYYLNNHGNSSTMLQANNTSSPKSYKHFNDPNLSLKDNIVHILKTSIDKNQMMPSPSIATARSPRQMNRNTVYQNKLQTEKPKNSQQIELQAQPSLDRWQSDIQNGSDDVSLGNESTMFEGESLLLPTRYYSNKEEQVSSQPNKKKEFLPQLYQQVKSIKEQPNLQILQNDVEVSNKSETSNTKLSSQAFSTCCDHLSNLCIDPSQKHLFSVKQQSSPLRLNPQSQLTPINIEINSLTNPQQSTANRTPSVKSRIAKQYFQMPKYYHQKENNLKVNDPSIQQSTKNQNLFDFSFEPIGRAKLNKREDYQNSISQINDSAKLNQALKQTERQRERSNSPKPKEKNLIKNVLLPPKEVTASSWSAFDFEEKSFIDGKLCYIQREIASLTKIMTFYVAHKFFEELQLDTKLILFQVTEVCTLLEGTSAKLEKDTWLSVWDLFHGLLLPSGNDCAELITQKVGAMIELKQKNQLTPQMDMLLLNKELDKISSRSKMNFLVKMNEYSKVLGMNSTFFSNTTGLSDSNNLSTAFDIGLLCIECMQIPIFRQIVRKKEHVADIYDNQSEKLDKIWFNTNKLLTNGFCGIKTGITGSAGPCLASFIKIKDSETGIKKQIIIVLLDSYTVEDRWEDSYLLARWAIKAVQHSSKYKEH